MFPLFFAFSPFSASVTPCTTSEAIFSPLSIIMHSLYNYPQFFFFLFKFFLKADKHWESKLFHSTFLSGEVIMWKFIHLVIRAQIISLYYIDLEKKKKATSLLPDWSTVMALHKRFEKTCWNASNQTRLERLHGVVL